MTIKGLTGIWILAVFGLSCSKEQDNWSVYYEEIGSYSSPRLADITGDGIKDVVIGAGQNEFLPCDKGVIAIDGKNGRELWTVSSTDQMVGSASFADLDEDGIQDVIIGGRIQNLVAVEGETGRELWRYKVESDEYSPRGLARFNFYNTIVLGDIDQDRTPDLLVANGGNVHAPAAQRLGRHPGVLMVLSGKSGVIISADTVPDGNETYMSPVVFDNDYLPTSVVFGTGGETFGGGLFVAPLSDVIAGNIGDAVQVAKSSEGHGFIAPPVIVDIDGDSIEDIVISDHGGKLIALCGKDFSPIWESLLDSVEVNATPAVGFFNADSIPDLFIHGSMGTWPANTGTRQMFVDGRNGAIMKKYRLGCSGFSSPIAYDFDQNGIDEVLHSVNIYPCITMNTFYSKIGYHLFSLDSSTVWQNTLSTGKNIASTPWIGDVDNDEKLDFVFLKYTNMPSIHRFYGMQINRQETDISIHSKIKWGAYMGSSYNGLY